MARYMVSHGFFRKGEFADICVRHLGVDGEVTTRERGERDGRAQARRSRRKGNDKGKVEALVKTARSNPMLERS